MVETNSVAVSWEAVMAGGDDCGWLSATERSASDLVGLQELGTQGLHLALGLEDLELNESEGVHGWKTSGPFIGDHCPDDAGTVGVVELCAVVHSRADVAGEDVGQHLPVVPGEVGDQVVLDHLPVLQ